MYFVDWALIGYVAYVPPFLILYFLELIAIFQNWRKGFNSSFYRVFSALAVVNISACLLGSFVFRLVLYPLVNGIYASMHERSGWWTVMYSGAYYLNCLSEFLGVFLAFNRFTTLYFPMLHEQFWRWALVLGITLCALISVAPVWYLFDNINYFEVVLDEKSNISWYYMEDLDDEPQVSIYFNMFIVTAVCNAASSLLYGACLVRICVYSMKRNYKVERNFFLVGFFTMIFSLPYMAAMLYFYHSLSLNYTDDQMDLITFVAYQLPWLTDLKYLTPAPMLLITNGSIRLAIVKMCLKGELSTITAVTRVTTRTTHPSKNTVST